MDHMVGVSKDRKRGLDRTNDAIQDAQEKLWDALDDAKKRNSDDKKAYMREAVAAIRVYEGERAMILGALAPQEAINREETTRSLLGKDGRVAGKLSEWFNRTFPGRVKVKMGEFGEALRDTAEFTMGEKQHIVIEMSHQNFMRVKEIYENELNGAAAPETDGSKAGDPTEGLGGGGSKKFLRK